MRPASAEKLASLQGNPANIRNICILAHVDHGKTTLADSLVASNGLISQRMAGKLRYMDSREDEQLRGITMKSSAISLQFNQGKEEFLINLIDSPGHIDFTSEVSTAVRLCDGAIVVVDCVEGVCPQTQMVLRQAWSESIKPVLVLNKLDRLITELKMSPLEAHLHLRQILEHVNSVTAELFASEVMQKSSASTGTGDVVDLSDGLEENDDSNLYFSPDQGNVVFACSLQGWGFGIGHFAELYSKKLGISADLLRRTMWGDYYLDMKNKRIRRGALSKGKKALFVAFILDNLWNVYDAVLINRDKQKMEKIISALQLKLAAREMRSTDPQVHLRTICSQWLPLATAVLDMVVRQLPSPQNMSPDRAEKLLCGPGRKFQSLPVETQNLKSAFLACKCDDGLPVVVFVSKMVAVERKSLPQNRPKSLSADEINARRERARQKRLQTETEEEKKDSSSAEIVATKVCGEEEKEDDLIFVAFARIFSGSLKKGQKLFVLGPKHNPEKALTEEGGTQKHIKEVEIEDLYLFMGRELESLSEVPAGNILGVTGLEKHILKSATLSNDIACPAFAQQYSLTAPIVRVALEPKQPGDMRALAEGLKLLHQADPCVQVLVQNTGEHVIVTAGEIHLNKCIDDLVQRFARVEVNVSAPIVPFRETIVPPPKTDVLNELISDQNQCVQPKGGEDSSGEEEEEEEEEEEGEIEEPGLVSVHTPNGRCRLRLRALPLPEEVTSLLVENCDLLKLMSKSWADSSSGAFEISDQTLSAVNELKRKLSDSFTRTKDAFWDGVVDRIWSLGPNRYSPNLLINRAEGVETPSVWSPFKVTEAWRYANSVVSGFQIATQAGPLCGEPLMGVAFVLESVEMREVTDLTEHMQELSVTGLSGQIMSCVKSGCRKAFQSQPQRLMAAMYCCHIQATADVLGKMYAVLGKRGGRVLHEDLIEGSSVFDVTAVLPVVESFGAVAEFRKRTSGLANPQLSFSHWEVIDMDPFWVPTTEEEYAHYGEKADCENVARKYMNSVRRRKGLWVKEQIVQFAEKQRTLTRNK